jgi:hypothetical protein
LNGITSLPNYMKMYQVVHKIYIDPLCLTPAMTLSRFCPKVNNLVTIVTTEHNKNNNKRTTNATLAKDFVM